MKRLLALIAGGLGVRALLRRRARPAAQTARPAPSPAEGLRAKLAAARSQEPEPAPPQDEPQDVAARRADVHERARRAIDELDT